MKITDEGENPACNDAMSNDMAIVPATISVKNRDGHFTLVNPAQADLYGLKPEDMVGQAHAAVIGETYSAIAGRRERYEHHAAVGSSTHTVASRRQLVDIAVQQILQAEQHTCATQRRCRRPGGKGRLGHRHGGRNLLFAGEGNLADHLAQRRIVHVPVSAAGSFGHLAADMMIDCLGHDPLIHLHKR